MKRFLRFLPIIVLLFTVSATVTSCSDDDDAPAKIKELVFDDASAKLVRDGIEFSAARDEANLRFQNNVANTPALTVTYPASSERDWLSAKWRPVSETEMTVTITCSENNSPASRSGIVVMNVQGYKSVRVHVTQKGY